MGMKYTEGFLFWIVKSILGQKYFIIFILILTKFLLVCIDSNYIFITFTLHNMYITSDKCPERTKSGY